MKPIRIPGIDVRVQLVFRSEHLQMLLPYFEKAGIAPTFVDEMINAYVASGEKVTYERWILEYGQFTLNPVMNKKLGRAIDHPTFNAMLLYVLKDIMDADPMLALLNNAKELR